MRFLAVLLIGLACLAESPKTTIRGKLTQQESKPPVMETAGHKLISLDGDEQTKAVLKDKRLAGADLEAIGHFSAPDLFVVDPIHTRALWVHKNGKKLLITYWCDVCSIRTYSPGLCWCCQQETHLDLREPDKE
jgi:hypothetical protein